MPFFLAIPLGLCAPPPLSSSPGESVKALLFFQVEGLSSPWAVHGFLNPRLCGGGAGVRDPLVIEAGTQPGVALVPALGDPGWLGGDLGVWQEKGDRTLGQSTARFRVLGQVSCGGGGVPSQPGF